MNEELTLKAMNLFETPTKWDAFCELVNRKEEIQNRWWKKLQTEVYQRELKNPHPDWNIYIWNQWDIKWYIRGESMNSMVIHFWGEMLRVVNYGALDKIKVNELLKDPKFDTIKNCFDRVDGYDNETLGWEIRNFSFQTIYDGRFPDNRVLSWFAGNKTEEFAEQLIAKVRKFQTPEITALFKEINEKCKP